jgi:monofunctional biosynthetic peptidoglycan transglycosylase
LLLAAVLPNPTLFRVTSPSKYVRSRQGWILKQMNALGGETHLTKLD